VTRTRHLTRTAVFATSSALLAIAATGTAAAWTRSAAPAAPAASVVAVAAPVVPAVGTVAAGVALSASASAPAPRTLTQVVTTTTVPAPVAAAKPAATTAPAKKRAAKPVVISRYTYAPGSQKAIDQCKLVLWSTRPMWLAAHNYCGYQWMSSVPKGRTITITSGKAAGTYVVTGHLRLTRQSGSMPAVKADLVLQTCVGSGTGLTLARRVR
jgi:hypothetical protein